MLIEEIRRTQRRVGTDDDGFWGPKSIAACQRHLRALMPNPNPWPKTDQASLQLFYGSPGDETMLVAMKVPDGATVKYDGRKVATIRVHQKCAQSLSRILVAISKVHPSILEQYEGVYVNRPMRGGSLPSLHARGAAIDLDAENNGNHVAWPLRATMPIEVMECFAREGWKSAGAFWGRDAMHHEASQ